MKPIHEIVNELWEKQKAIIDLQDNNLVATLEIKHGFIDIMLRGANSDEYIGYITIEHPQSGTYFVHNNPKLIQHPDFQLNNGTGLAVQEQFKNMGYESALLSLGIGTAQKHYLAAESKAAFAVIMPDRDETDWKQLYEPFGFLKSNERALPKYVDASIVKELKITPRAD